MKAKFEKVNILFGLPTVEGLFLIFKSTPILFLYFYINKYKMNIAVIIFFLFIIVAFVISIWLNLVIIKGGGVTYFAETDANVTVGDGDTKTKKHFYFHAKKIDYTNNIFWYNLASKTVFATGTGNHAVRSFEEVLSMVDSPYKYVCYISEVIKPIDDTVNEYNPEKHNILMVVTVVTSQDSLIMSPMGIFKNPNSKYGGLAPYLQVFAAKVMLDVNSKLIDGYMLTSPMTVMKEILRRDFPKDSYMNCIRQEDMKIFKKHIENEVNGEWYKWVKKIDGDIKEKINKEKDLDSLYSKIIQNSADPIIQNAWKSHLYSTGIDYVKYMKRVDELESKKDEIISNFKKAWEEQSSKYKKLSPDKKNSHMYYRFPNSLEGFATQYSREKFGNNIHFTNENNDFIISSFSKNSLIDYFIETDYVALYKFYKRERNISIDDSWKIPNVICTDRDLVVIKPDTEEILIKITANRTFLPGTLDSLENYEKYYWLIDSTYKPKGNTYWFSIPVKKLTEHFDFTISV